MTDGRADGSRVRTVFLGSGAFGRECLRVLSTHPDVELIGVITAPARAAGRSQALTPTPIEELARDLWVARILTPERLRAPEAIAAVLALRPEMVVLADYGQIVPGALLDLPHGALNLHPSLLPRHRGASPIPAAILAGDAETGVTLMRMDRGLDTGPIVAQVHHPLDGRETAPFLEDVLEAEAGSLLDLNLRPWVRGELEPRPQSGSGATLTRPLRREDGRLDPTRSALELERQVRAYQPWPGSFAETPEGRITVWSATVGSASGGVPGRIDAAGFETGDGHLSLSEVQPAGGKRMPWAAYVRGRPSIVGTEIVRP